jgi:hypothetical protein
MVTRGPYILIQGIHVTNLRYWVYRVIYIARYHYYCTPSRPLIYKARYRQHVGQEV